MSFWDWFFGGKNFEETNKANVGDIIYPAYNGTNGWFKMSRWDIVLAVDKKGKIICRKYIWDVATVNAIELIRELKIIGVKGFPNFWV